MHRQEPNVIGTAPAYRPQQQQGQQGQHLGFDPNDQAPASSQLHHPSPNPNSQAPRWPYPFPDGTCCCDELIRRQISNLRTANSKLEGIKDISRHAIGKLQHGRLGWPEEEGYPYYRPRALPHSPLYQDHHDAIQLLKQGKEDIKTALSHLSNAINDLQRHTVYHFDTERQEDMRPIREAQLGNLTPGHDRGSAQQIIPAPQPFDYATEQAQADVGGPIQQHPRGDSQHPAAAQSGGELRWMPFYTGPHQSPGGTVIDSDN